jgi:hypothetical protein
VEDLIQDIDSVGGSAEKLRVLFIRDQDNGGQISLRMVSDFN